jgi:hypothetical protein
MEKETIKLLNVLRRIARAARHASWAKSDADATRFCATQYNKVLARLAEIEPSVKTLFTPLPENAPAEVIRIAAGELGAYFEDEAPETPGFGFAFGCAPQAWRGRARGGFRARPVHCE